MTIYLKCWCVLFFSDLSLYCSGVHCVTRWYFHRHTNPFYLYLGMFWFRIVHKHRILTEQTDKTVLRQKTNDDSNKNVYIGDAMRCVVPMYKDCRQHSIDLRRWLSLRSYFYDGTSSENAFKLKIVIKLIWMHEIGRVCCGKSRGILYALYFMWMHFAH